MRARFSENLGPSGRKISCGRNPVFDFNLAEQCSCAQAICGCLLDVSLGACDRLFHECAHKDSQVRFGTLATNDQRRAQVETQLVLNESLRRATLERFREPRYIGRSQRTLSHNFKSRHP
jgi:hypothetical protein